MFSSLFGFLGVFPPWPFGLLFIFLFCSLIPPQSQSALRGLGVEGVVVEERRK